ncbi:hypothetical protein U062_00564 [Gammaproteobacteria bacterium MOLA455]|nr:hypothetical protein U062_00564 [Gammaproteobacteria bacterium MOLA455]
MIRSLIALFLSLSVGQAVASGSGNLRVLDFDVFLNDREVGKHRFELLEQGESVAVSSTMSLDFKLFKIKSVTYRHQANEIWQAGCLVGLQSETEKQGKTVAVEAVRDQSGLVIQRPEGVETITGCVRGFSYWNPQWLEGEKLLNAETGINSPVEISSDVSEQDNTTHIKIALAKADIDLQYSAAGEWLSLQTELLIGGTLRYQRVF